MIKTRYLTSSILEDLKDKMVFVGGPRQVGKTTLAVGLVGPHFRAPARFNWDKMSDRRRIIASDWPGDADLIVLDKIHKYRKWKRFLKGEYDTQKERYAFMVTGSARLDVFRKGSDSLMGRYHHYLLHPFSLAELHGHKSESKPFEELAIGPARPGLDVLERYGGFPEPLFRQDERAWRRWQNERNQQLFREDIRDVESIRDLTAMKMLSDLLPSKVGSLLSANSLREDLDLSHRTVLHWLDILETFHSHFRIYPFTQKFFRSIKKAPKLYLWDWSEVPNEANRFENVVASHLLKFVSWMHDREGHRAKLYYLRDIDQREVDFMVTVDEKPWFAIEVKTQEETVSPHLRYFKENLKIPYAYQVIRKSGIDSFNQSVRVISADKFLSSLI